MKRLSTILAAAALAVAFTPASASAQQQHTHSGAGPGLVPQGHNLMMVQANAVSGQDAEFERWYDGHIKDILALPGVVRAQRFKMLPRTGRPNPAWGYVILYEFMGTPDALMAALGTAAKAGKVQLPDKRYVLGTEGSTWAASGPGQAAQ